jgi:hypothetical protein
LQPGFWSDLAGSTEFFLPLFFLQSGLVPVLGRPGLGSTRQTGSDFKTIKPTIGEGVFFFFLPFFKLNHYPTLFHNNKHYWITIATFLKFNSHITLTLNSSTYHEIIESSDDYKKIKFPSLFLVFSTIPRNPNSQFIFKRTY